MNIIQYIYPELFLFIGFLFYFTYNVFSMLRISTVIFYVNKFFSFDLQDQDLNTVKKVNDLFISYKLSLEKKVIFQKIKYLISEKNSFFYIAILCFITMCLYINQLFWFLDMDTIINNKIYIFGSIYVVDTFSIFLKILITFLAFFFFYYFLSC